MSKKNRKLGMGVQSLEAKTMMAGDAAVAFSGGDLFITEAADSIGEDQQVQVSKLEDGRVEVRGLNGTQIQAPYFYFNPWTREIVQSTLRREAFTYSGVDDLNVSLGEGNDKFTTSTSHGGISVDDINIDMGVGNDRDEVRLNGVNASGLVDIKTGGGNDYVRVYKGQLTAEDESSTDELKIDTGDGLDTVSLFRTNVNGDVSIDTSANNGLNERDTVSIQDATMDDLEIDLGGGNDQVTMRFATMDDGVINGGNGNDDVYAESVEADNLDFNGNAGLDEFFARYYYSGTQDSNDIDDLDLNSASLRTW